MIPSPAPGAQHWDGFLTQAGTAISNCQPTAHAGLADSVNVAVQGTAWTHMRSPQGRRSRRQVAARWDLAYLRSSPPASLSNMVGAVLLLSCPDMRQQHLKTGKYNIMPRIQLSLTGSVLNGMQASLQRVEGVSHRQWEDALTVGELKGKYAREQWLKSAEAEAISLHHEQRSRGTVPSYGQALAMATLMEEMHLEVQNPPERNIPDPPSREP